MILKTLLENYDAKITGDSSIEITSIEYNSREVKAQSIFVAVKGFAVDGHVFIESAIKNGAVAVLSESEPTRTDITWIQVKSVRASMADFAAKIYNVTPSNLNWVGVTGTNGKTTVATLFDQIATAEFERKNCWQFGTIGNRLGERLEEAERTTPEAVDLLRMIGTAPEPPKLITMEVSSHALELERVRGIEYDVAIFTNLTQDHLDFHGGMETYFEAKKRLFTEHLKANGKAIINIDDAFGARLVEELNSENVISCGRAETAIFKISSSHCSWEKTFFRAGFNGRRYKFESPLVGHFNVMNMAVTAAAALALEIPYETID